MSLNYIFERKTTETTNLKDLSLKAWTHQTIFSSISGNWLTLNSQLALYYPFFFKAQKIEFNKTKHSQATPGRATEMLWVISPEYRFILQVLPHPSPQPYFHSALFKNVASTAWPPDFKSHRWSSPALTLWANSQLMQNKESKSASPQRAVFVNTHINPWDSSWRTVNSQQLLAVTAQ